MVLEVIDKRERIIRLKVPNNLDLICQRERYKVELLEDNKYIDRETEIGFYVESLEASEWLIIDSKCSNSYNKETLCQCKVGTLIEATEFVKKFDREKMAGYHLESIFQISSHLKSYLSSRGYGEYFESLCPSCLVDEEGHEERLLDLLNVKVEELREFWQLHKVKIF